MDTHLYAWAAGLLDADGTITIKRQKHGNRYNYISLIQLSQVDTEKGRKNTARLQELFGGGRILLKRKSNSVWTWQTTSRNAAECIRKILPYMVGKKAQAELLDAFVEKFFVDQKFHHLTDKERNARESFFRKMRTLQEKGFEPTTTERQGA